jgi:hypothetical protein
MYKEFIKKDEEAMEFLKKALIKSELPEISLKLGDMETSIRFVESHFQDIKAILANLGI